MELFYRDWIVDDARGTVLLIHGTAEHSGRYEHVAEYLIGRGYNVVSGDLPGWGRSPGLKGHIESFQEYLDAVEAWISLALTKLPSHLPLFVLGHSLGGLVATRFVQEYKNKERLAGLVLSSPCLALKVEVPAWKAGLADALDKIWPKLRMGNDIAPYQVTRDPVMQVKYQNDPLNYKKVSVRWFQELQREMKNAAVNSQKINLPTLVLQAGSDCLIDPQKVENFVWRLPSTDKTFISFPGLYHEVFNEPERQEVLEQLGTWLDNHVSTKHGLHNEM
ncbi:lysophospholipase [Brevibacillus sp. SYSU BS000544]|uniref:alpha/beta hydrolase n=1 Tax=Brevibacillus sp. SYSU BS000544 TaxID=3416443 RepID=UPI003CE5C029